MIKQQFKKALSLLLALLLLLTVFAPQLIKALPLDEIGKGPVVIHQVYGGGGNSGADYKNDFIVLHNRSDADIDLAGWSVQYASKTGTFNNVTELTGTIKANGYYLIQQAAGSGGTLELPRTPDDMGSAAMAAKEAKVLLASDTVGVLSSDSPSATLVETYPNIVDYVGIGPAATAYLGTGQAPIMSNTTMISRKAYTGDNSADYEIVSAAAGALDYLVAEPEIPDDRITIAEARALATGEAVKVSGVVTGKNNKYTWIQDDTAAIVLYNAVGEVAVGDRVTVEGITGVYNGLKQIANGTMTRDSSGNPIPAPIQTTIQDIENNVEEYQSHRVRLKNLTITTLNTGATSTFTDGSGKTITAYQMPAPTDTEIVEGSVVDVVAHVDHFNAPQLIILSGDDFSLPSVLQDPVTDEDVGDATNLRNAQALTAGTHTVVGSVAYKFGGNSIIIQDTIDAEIYGFQLYDYSNFDTYIIGDIVKVTGTVSSFGGVPQIGSTTKIEILRSDTPYDPQEVTIEQLETGKDNYLSEFVIVKNVTLGTYSSSGTTLITDEGGKTFPIYRGAAFPPGVTAGDLVDVLAAASKHNTTYQLRVGSSNDYIVANDVDGPVITAPTLLAGKIGEPYKILGLDVVDNVGVATVTVSILLGGEIVGEPFEMTKNPDTGKYEVEIPGSYIVNKEFTFKFDAVDVNGNAAESVLVDMLATDQPEIKSVLPAPNTATEDDRRPEIIVNFTNAGENPVVKLTLNEDEAIEMMVEGEQAKYVPTAALEEGIVEAAVTITRAEDGEVGVYAWKFTIGEALYNFYFGQIHSHTAEYSDGSGTLAQALNYASNAHQIDFFAVTDHSNYFDNVSNLGTFDDRQSGLESLTNPGNSMWATYVDQINSANSEDFVTFYGFEMTWSGGPGHMNTYMTEGFVSRNDPKLNSKSNSHDEVLIRYYDLLKEQETSFSMFNHPGTTFGTFNDFAHWDPAVDAKVQLIEVGNGEGPVGSSGYWPSYQYYTQALDKGWHLAPANNQDNHKGKWGDANTTRTVAIADELTRESIYSSINDLMVYATEDDNFEIYYTANGLPMGSSFAESPETIDFIVDLHDPDPDDTITKLEVISSGGVISYSERIGTNSAQVEFTIPNTAAYYYLKVVQADDQIIVTAPVWTGETTLVGINKVEKDSAMEIIGTPFNVSTEVYNYEDENLVIEKVEYTIDERIVGTYTAGLPEVVSNSTVTITHEVTPEMVGEQYLQVAITGALNGRPVKFNSSIKLNVYDQSQLLKIGVDSFHDNFYVSGDYSGSDSNFIAVAAQLGGIVEHIDQEFTFEKLSEYDILIMTAPYLGFGKGGKAYTAAELQAIKEYAESGGNIVLTSKSDRGNEGGTNAAATSNAILEAIGAKTRVADGIVVDNERKENEAYRLNLVEALNFNEVNELAEGLFSDTTGQFTLYNSAPILANGATPIVVGYPTSWGANYTADFGGSSSYVPVYDTDTVVVPKGEVNVVTTETLSGGGFLVTAGVTFFSTFEVKTEMLQDRDTRTANYRLVQNIIELAKPEPTITPIADVQAAPEGKFFTIEGTLTSNASGYDTATAFFDSAYVQDETGGINIFPIAGNYQAGQKVRISGTTSSYNGEHQLNIAILDVIDESINEIEPILLNTQEIKENLGLLVKLEGVITDVVRKDNVVETIVVKDDFGEIIVFIDGYIMPTYLMMDIEVGNSITAIGLSSISVNDEGEQIQRIRVRNRTEVVAKKAVDKSELQELYDQALALDLDKYTDQSAAKLGQEIDRASALLEKADASQAEVDNQIQALKAALNALVEKDSPGEEPTEPGEEPTEPGEEQEGYSLVDTLTGIQVFIPTGAFENRVKLMVKMVERAIKGREVLAYDITFIDTITNETVQPKVPVTVRIPVKDLITDGLEVLHETGPDQYEKLSFRLKNKAVEFESDDFSVYLLSAALKTVPATGETSRNLIAGIFLLLAGAGVSVLFVRRKVKEGKSK